MLYYVKIAIVWTKMENVLLFYVVRPSRVVLTTKLTALKKKKKELLNQINRKCNWMFVFLQFKENI